MRKLLGLSVIMAVGACSSIGNANYGQGQLFCSKATASGPLTVALLTDLGVPVNVTNKSAQFVVDACKAWDLWAAPVTAPPAASPATVPAVSAPVPKGP